VSKLVMRAFYVVAGFATALACAHLDAGNRPYFAAFTLIALACGAIATIAEGVVAARNFSRGVDHGLERRATTSALASLANDPANAGEVPGA
jgi:hypothetical protein